MIVNGRIFDLLLLIAMFILVYIMMQRAKTSLPELRTIAGLEAIVEVVERCAEMGKPVYYGVGWGGTGVSGFSAQQMVGVIGLQYVSEMAGARGVEVVTPTDSGALVPVLEATVEAGYIDAGVPEMYNQGMVRFLPNAGLSYGVALSGLAEEIKPGGSVWIGNIFSPFIMVLETVNRLGAIQVMGTDSMMSLCFLVPIADYVLIGEEMYAAGAVLSQDPVKLGSTVAQDVAKVFFLGLLFIGVVLASINMLEVLTQIMNI